MFYSIWLLAAALAGWASGKFTSGKGFGSVADVLLGITGAFVVRCFMEKIGISLNNANLLFLSIWGASAFPVAAKFWIRLLGSKTRS
jgi:uncharacterized membrane protein YeaQ/YmgE (transglycosylase-associated protein family)